MAAAARAKHHGDGDHRSSARSSMNLKEQGDLLAQENEAVDKELGGHWAFKIFVESMIVVNAVQLGICVQKDENPEVKAFCDYSEHVFITIFFIELLYRMYLLGVSYFRSKWNIFDFFLTFVAILDNWIFSLLLTNLNLPFGNIYVLRLARLIRILRILRVLRKYKELQMLMEGLLASLRSMFWVALLLGFFIYCFSIVCVTLFSTVVSDYPLNFHTLPEALFTLFSLAILGDWTDIVAPVVSDYPWSALMFVMFTIVGTFGILNLIIGVITETTIQVQQEFEEQEKLNLDIEHMRSIEEIANIVFATQDDSTITKDELEFFMEHDDHGPRILKLVQGISLPAGFTLLDCHPMFDRDASGSITKEEFCQGMERLIFGSEFQRACMTASAIADVLVEVKAVEVKVLVEVKAVEEKVLVEVKAVEERLTRMIREELRSLHQAGGNGGGGGAGSGDGTTPQLLARSGSKAKPAEVTSEHRQEAEAGGGIDRVLNLAPLEFSLSQLKAEFGDLRQVVKTMDQQLYPPPGNDAVLEVHALSQRMMRRLREPMFQLLTHSLEAEVSAGSVVDHSRPSPNALGSGEATFAYSATEISLLSPSRGSLPVPLVPRLRSGPRLRSPPRTAASLTSAI